MARAPSVASSSETLPDTVSTASMRAPWYCCSMTARTRDAAALAAASPPSGFGKRIWYVRGPPDSWMEDSPSSSRSTRARSCSTSIGWAKVTRIICPPTKSTPRFNPRTPTMARLAMVAISDRTSARLRHRMKSMLVLSGTSFKSFMSSDPPLDVERLWPGAPNPQNDQHPGEIDRRVDRCDDADQKHDGEAADRSRPEIEHQGGRDRVGDIGVENRGRGFPVARFQGVEHPPPAAQFLADSLVDEHVGVDRGADGQDE